jgi:hypothetical protein
MASKRYTANDVDTAMCIWEHILEQTRRNDDAICRWEAALGANGTAALRDWVIDQIDVVWNAFELAGGGEAYGMSFDWDFVPAFMELAYDDELELRLEYEEIAKQIFEEAK